MSRAPMPFRLRPFQQRVFEAVMRGESVILQAPTGAGKTRAALAPFIQNLANASSDPSYTPLLPLTCRYAVPLRVLAGQFFKEYQHTADRIDARLSTRLRETYRQFEQLPVQIQTGEQPNDPEFASALTFCTIDQLLASFVGIPYGVGGRRANLNVGAVLGAYQVFDEFHLYPLRGAGQGCWGARTTTLQMLHMQRVSRVRLAPFVLMTATFSTHLLRRLAADLGAAVVDVEPGELAALGAGRERRLHVHGAPMEARAILEAHDGCSLVICNTVLRAQQIALELRALAARARPATQIILLHSRFSDADRRDKQAALEAELGKPGWEGDQYRGRDLIVVATQVVEVGLDISARLLHSEAAPASSIVQRAGRCARFDAQRGTVHLYPPRPGPDGTISYRPYEEADCLASLEAFARYDGQLLGFPEEQQVIDAVHTAQDARLLDDFERQCGLIGQQIYRGWSEHSRSIASDLIRDVQQATLLIHDDPNAAVTERPWEWQTFRIHPGSLERAWDTLAQAHSTAQTLDRQDTAMAWQALLADTAQGRGEENERRAARYQWTPLAGKAQVRGALILALSPTVATYTPELGLVLRDGRLELPWPEQPYRSAPVPQRRRGHGPFFYQQESYAEHITGLLRAYQALLWQDTRVVAARLEQALGLRPGAIDQAIRLAIACHDIAKLGRGWQSWARGWQDLLCQTYPHLADDYRAHKLPLAHTDVETREQREQEYAYTRTTPRPHHACESAYLALPLIESSLGEEAVARGLARAVAGAIARHHTPGATSYSPTVLIPAARAEVQAMLELVSQGLPWSYDITLLDSAITRAGELTNQDITLPRSDNPHEALLYFLIVRVLRLADTRSFSYK